MIAAFRSVRALGRHWKLAGIAAFSLAIAMALGIVGLSVSNTLLVLPPTAPAPDRLVMIYGHSDTGSIDQFSFPDYEYYRKNNQVFTDIAAAPNSISVNADFNFEGREVSVITRPVSENYFDVLALRPFLGRSFAPGDNDSKTQLAVMTYSCWTRLGSDPHMVGKTLVGNRIIGVAPPSFAGGFWGLDGDLLTTLGPYPSRTDRTARHLPLIARLKPEITRQQAQVEITALAGQLASAYPKEDKGRTAVVTRATLLAPDSLPTARLMSSILMGFVLLVLLIACANVANLLLAVAVGRRQEAAIKLALGAPRKRLIREFLAGSTLLCVAGGILGYLVAAAAIARFSRFTIVLPALGPFSFGLHLQLDATVIGLSLLLLLIASLATGLAPALYASSPALAHILSGEIVVGGTRKNARRNALVIVQVAVCTLVLVGMGLCQRNLYNLRHTDLGFSARNLVGDTVYIAGEGYDETRGKQLYEKLRQTVSAVPGVEAVTLSLGLPVLGASPLPVELPGGAKTIPISHTVVDSDYFSTLGIRILAGRVFNSADRENTAPVAVINQKMADMFLPGQDPVGKAIRADEPLHAVTVVGVVADGKYIDLDELPRPFLYYPLSQHYEGAISVIARTKGDPRLWVEPMARALRGLGLHILIQPVTLANWMTLALLGQRVVAGCVAVLSALGLLLAVIGLFGAISYAVSERKKELGIRVALGALPRQLLQMVLRQTLTVAGAGIVIGLLLGVAATVILQSQFYGINPVEWSVLVPVAAAMLVLSLLVAGLSAKPWITVDPMESVRHA